MPVPTMRCMGTNSPMRRTPLFPVGSRQGNVLCMAAAPLPERGGGVLKKESSIALCAVKSGLPPGTCLRYRGSWGYMPLMYFEVRADLFIAKQTFTNMLAYPALAMGGVQEATKEHSLEMLSGEELKHPCILLREEQTHCSEQVCRYIHHYKVLLPWCWVLFNFFFLAFLAFSASFSHISYS